MQLYIPFSTIRSDDLSIPTAREMDEFIGLTVERSRPRDETTIDWLTARFPREDLTRQDYRMLAICIERSLEGKEGIKNSDIISELGFTREQAQACSSRLRHAGLLESTRKGGRRSEARHVPSAEVCRVLESLR